MKYIAIILICCSCSASWHIKTAMRKDPTLFQADTVQLIDTLVVHTESVDTTFIQQMDTVIQFVQKDNRGQEIKIKYLWNTKTDTVQISVDCPEQEIITKTNTVTKTVTIKPTLWESIRWGLIFLAILAVGRFVYKIFASGTIAWLAF